MLGSVNVTKRSEMSEMSVKNQPNWPYFAPFEVVIHNTPDDCWVSILGRVLNVTPLIKEHQGEKCIRPILSMAGKDISCWFDEKTGDIQHYINPENGCRVPYCPHGPIPDVPLQVPATNWRPLGRLPWWNDPKYQIGLLTKRVRPLRIINMTNPFDKEVLLNVCCEDTFLRIQERYSFFNSNAESYTWRGIDKNIFMNKTLDENGFPDERDLFTKLGLPQTYYIPTVFLYYNDDLKYPDLSDDECKSLNDN
nr:cytochrome b5 domain-containing protein 1 [Leptinotarsa decemlineata]